MIMPELDEELEQELDLFEEEEEIKPQLIDEEPIKEEDIFSEGAKVKSDDPTVQLIEQLLKGKGITDSKITLIDEDETEKEVSFFDLSQEEQLEILNSSGGSPKPETPTPDYGEQEKEFFQYLKDNNLTVAEYLEKYKEAAVSEVENQYEQSYDIDAYGDEELFLLDLKAKYDLTDEELEKELVKAKEDDDLFAKKVGKLREEYKELEDAYKAEEQNKFNLEREEQYNTLVQTMVDVAVQTPDLHGIELEDDEKNEVLSYLLELDENGSSEFYKELNTPARLYEAAWFLKYGKQAFETLVDAYEQEIKKLKGDNDDKKKVIIKKKDEKVKSIYEI